MSGGTKTVLDRRAALGVALTTGAALATPQLLAANATTRDTGVNALTKIVRLRGNPAGPCWLWFEGVIYNQRPDEVIEPFCGFTSVLAMRYVADGPHSYLFEQRESAHYTDLVTGEALSTIRNPVTDKTNHAVGYVSPIFSYRLTLEGVFSLRDGSLRGRFQRGLMSAGDDTWLTEFRANSFPTGLPRDEFPESGDAVVRHSGDVATYRARTRDLEAGGNDFVPAALSFTADTPWMQWMLMGDRPGQQMWVGQGSKVRSALDMSEELRSRVETLHPGFLADPFGLDGTPYSTIAQMRALRHAGKI